MTLTNHAVVVGRWYYGLERLSKFNSIYFYDVR